VPSPGNEFIPSLLDPNELISPLEKLLNYQLVINLMIFILIIFMLFFIFNRYILKFNLELINKILSKYLSLNFKNKIDKFMNKSNDLNIRFLIVLFVLNGILLLYFIFLNIYITSELIFNLDDYIDVHINIKKKIKF